ncbi:hypothetical protein SERLA73DRAFT_186192 [Serpula lacrymans var. lacrymans S7.3]|uniref:Uncharacterized protein n=2 Tax=Serpula lacrymans var. lacrymans TaxID=341189 RepID=F8Q5I4_SERL3|nr:uncharacterized protein SERLADRAFT_475108 [Serpula lacrymans var. lacrymans S7.9]EGN96455.1 hypothetical protein SERLA73DRAFT_186192 [Serpula lacrymans var. lacrymans S7.3]EGO22003.1 hypothetical protein SERLADRAFT_475108 [Serpula lacrymans var. lacrymans S7.9]
MFDKCVRESQAALVHNYDKEHSGICHPSHTAYARFRAAVGPLPCMTVTNVNRTLYLMGGTIDAY